MQQSGRNFEALTRQALTLVLFALLLLLFFHQGAKAQSLVDEHYQIHYSDRDRIYLQNDLVVTGDYDDVVNGILGPSSIEAIKAFQKRNGFRPTGLLSEDQRTLLDEQKLAAIKKFQLTSFDDNRAGFSYMVLSGHVKGLKKKENGTRFQGMDGRYIQTVFNDKNSKSKLRGLYNAMLKKEGKAVFKKQWAGDHFVIYHANMDFVTYMAVHGDGRDIRGVMVILDQEVDADFGAGARFIIRSFMPFNEMTEPFTLPAPTAPAAPAPQMAKKQKPSPSAPQTGTQTGPDTHPEKSPATNPAPKAIAKAPETFNHPASTLHKQADAPKITLPVKGMGTGFFVTKQGHIATNHHVIDGCKAVTSGRWGETEVVMADKDNDFAVLKLKHVSGQSAPLHFSAKGPTLGRDVLALGYPLPGTLSSDPKDLSVTSGVISNLAGLLNDKRYVTTSAPVEPGNSGGPLVDRHGRVVGVITAKLKAKLFAEKTGDLPQNVNLALKSQMAQGLLLRAGVSYQEDDPHEETVSIKTLVDALKPSIVSLRCH